MQGQYATSARLLVGTAAIAAAVTIPDLSLFAMGSPYAQIEIGSRTQTPTALWSPAVKPAAPVYRPVIAAEAFELDSLTYSGTPVPVAPDRRLPLEFLAAGSERFELAFAGTELPSPVAVRLPYGARRPNDTMPAPRAGLVEVEQIGPSRAVRPAPVNGLRAASPELASEPGANRALATSDAALEAAFAGAIDVSGAVREAIPTAPRQARSPTARAAPIAAPDPALDAAAAAQARTSQKTQLGARINGVLTGSVEFRQLDGTIAIRLGSVLDMLRDRYSAGQFDRLAASQSANRYVTLAQLQAAGIPISYNPAYDEVEFGIDYQDAPQAAKVQVEQIGAQTAISESVMIDQIPR